MPGMRRENVTEVQLRVIAPSSFAVTTYNWIQRSLLLNQMIYVTSLNFLWSLVLSWSKLLI